jgi:lysophospholipase L1-like esterase
LNHPRSANDIRFLPAQAEEIRGAIKRDLSRLRDQLAGRPILVVTYYPVVPLSERASLLNQWIADTASQLGLQYVDAFRRVIDGNVNLMCDDGIHPNDDGHRALADAILPAGRTLHLPV